MVEVLEALMKLFGPLGVGAILFVMLAGAVYALATDRVVSGARYREHLADCKREVERERARGDRLSRHAVLSLDSAERGIRLAEVLSDRSGA